MGNMKAEMVLARRAASLVRRPALQPLRRIGYSVLGFGLAALASAQTNDWDIGEVTSTTNTLLGVGVVVTVAMVVFKVGKRAANKV